MPTSANRAWALDTSVAVPYLDETHLAHSACVAEIGSTRPSLAGHAAYETYSVLTRLPGATRIAPVDALEALRAAFPEPCWLSPDQQSTLLETLVRLGLSGGQVYDALVGEAARVHDRVLLTRDRRAERTYDLIGVTYRFIGR